MHCYVERISFEFSTNSNERVTINLRNILGILYAVLLLLHVLYPLRTFAIIMTISIFSLHFWITVLRSTRIAGENYGATNFISFRVLVCSLSYPGLLVIIDDISCWKLLWDLSSIVVFSCYVVRLLILIKCRCGRFSFFGIKLFCRSWRYLFHSPELFTVQLKREFLRSILPRILLF